MKNMILEGFDGRRQAFARHAARAARFRNGQGRRTRPDRIPKEARELFGIRPGDTLLVLGDEKNGLLVTPPDVMHDVARQIFQNLEEEENQK